MLKGSGSHASRPDPESWQPGNTFAFIGAPFEARQLVLADEPSQWPQAMFGASGQMCQPAPGREKRCDRNIPREEEKVTDA